MIFERLSLEFPEGLSIRLRSVRRVVASAYREECRDRRRVLTAPTRTTRWAVPGERRSAVALDWRIGADCDACERRNFITIVSRESDGGTPLAAADEWFAALQTIPRVKGVHARRRKG